MITCICSFRLSNRTYECIKNPHKPFWLITGVTLFKKNCVWKTRCQGKCSNLYSHEVTALKDTEQIKSRWWSFAVTFIWRTSCVSREEVPWWQVCNSSDGWHAHSATEQTCTHIGRVFLYKFGHYKVWNPSPSKRPLRHSALKDIHEWKLPVPLRCIFLTHTYTYTVSYPFIINRFVRCPL